MFVTVLDMLTYVLKILISLKLLVQYYKPSQLPRFLEEHCLLRPLREKCPNTEFFWSVFSYIRTECGDFIRRVNLRIQSEYRKIRTRKKSVFGHSSRSGLYQLVISTCIPGGDMKVLINICKKLLVKHVPRKNK